MEFWVNIFDNVVIGDVYVAMYRYTEWYTSQIPF
jgi:hypothetical protein